MQECVLLEIRRRPQRASFHQGRAQHRQACLTEKAASNLTGLTRRTRDHRVRIHAELLGRRTRCDNPQFDARMAALEVRHAGNNPAHREGRQHRYAQEPRRRRTGLQALRYCRQAIERSASFGEQIRPHLSQNRAAAGAQKETNVKSVFEQTYLPADSAMCNVQLFRSSREAAEPRSGFEGFNRVQGRQARSGHT